MLSWGLAQKVATVVGRDIGIGAFTRHPEGLVGQPFYGWLRSSASSFRLRRFSGLEETVKKAVETASIEFLLLHVTSRRTAGLCARRTAS